MLHQKKKIRPFGYSVRNELYIDARLRILQVTRVSVVLNPSLAFSAIPAFILISFA